MGDFSELGRRFSIYLKNKGLGVNETAKILDFSGSQISNITNGRVFGCDKMFKILNEFKDIDANQLFRGNSFDKKQDHPEIDYRQLWLERQYLIELQKEKINFLEKENKKLRK